MSPQLQWTNGLNGVLEAGRDDVRLTDALELAAAADRRLRLTWQQPVSWAQLLYSGAWVHRASLEGSTAPPLAGLRAALSTELLNAPAPVYAWEPPTPAAMQWLWPYDDGDENAVIVAMEPQQGQVNLFNKLNGTGGWTDPSLRGLAVRAVHYDELRQAVGAMSRGRFVMPLYLPGGLFQLLPDAPWVGQTVANNGSAELRAAGMAVLRDDASALGLVGLTVRPSSRLELTADASCTVEVYRCRRALEFVNDPPTWNRHSPAQSLAWEQPGALGAGDAELIGAVALQAGQVGALAGSELAAALQAMVDGQPQTFVLRRADAGYETITISPATLAVEFDLSRPPN